MTNENAIKYYEEVVERVGQHVIRSTTRQATDQEIKEAQHLHAQGKCPHTIIVDEPSWLYDIRSCVICGQGLGLI